MKFRRIILIVFLVLVGASLIYALMDKRDVTTSSDKAYEAYRRGVELSYRLYNREALQAFEQAVKLDPNFAMAYSHMAWLYMSFDRKDEYQAARDKALSLLDRVKEKEKLLINFGFARSESRQADIARYKKELLDKYPNSIEALDMVCSDAFGTMNYDEAIAANLKIIEIDPNYASAYNLLGYSYFYKGDYDKALEYIDKYSSLAKDQANPHDSHGELLLYMGRYDEALEQFRKADSIKPDLYFVLSHIGDTYKEKGMYRDAVGAYLKAAEFSPNEKTKCNIEDNIAICYVQSAQEDKAIALLKEVLDKTPDDLKANALLGDIYSRQGNMDDALVQLGVVKGLTSQAIDKGQYSESDKAAMRSAENYLSGRISLARGDYKDAVWRFMALYSVSKQPDRNLFAVLCGEALLKANMPDSAVSLMSDALKLNPNTAGCLKVLADAYGKLGRKDAQKGALTRYLDIMKDADDNNPSVASAMAQMEQLNRKNL
jgi:tetratricopeptide (TPR) repeat protein